MKKILLVANLSITFSFLTLPFSYSQITVNTAATPAQMVANLVGPGVTYSNVTYTGDAVASAIFNNGNLTNLGMTSGVVLTSGSAALVPINNSGNQGVDNTGAPINELNVIAGANTYDGAILEFDFIPYANTINVRYIFGSEEYLEWVNAGYNDAFAFFISGPGIAGQQNIATVGGQPVTIDNINTTSNSAFYVNNPYDGSLATNRIEYDGFTTSLLATRTVIPCSTYHIKLMIADGGDAIYDSGVFIEENGLFSSGAITDVAVQPAYGFGSGVEGCVGTQFVFTMPMALPTNTTFNYTVGGTATSGLDYVPIPTSVTIPAGQTTATIPMNIIDDGIAEGNETITLTVQVSPCSTQTFTLTISDPTPISVTATDVSFCQGTGPVNISAAATGGNGTVTYSWSGGAGNGTPVSVNPGATTNYTVTATDQCGRAATDVSTVTVTPPPTSSFTATATVCQGTTGTLTYTGNAPTNATYNWNFAGGTSAPGGTVQGPHNVVWGTPGTYNVSLTVNQNGCISAPTTQTVTVNPTPTTPVAGSNSPICTGNTINLTSNTIAGATYYWTGPNGFTSAAEDPTIANATVGMAGTYNLYVVVNNCTSATAAVPVTVNTTPATPVVASNSPVCSGNPINLTANTIAGVSYNWTGPNGFTSSAEDPTIANATVAMTGTYNLYLTASGCTSATASVPVTVNQTPATPVVAANSPVCSGNPINLSANTIAGATYNWTGPNGFTSAAEDPTIANATVGMTGTYNLYMTANGCTSATASVPVVVNQTPATPVVASNNPVCSGNPINLTSNTIAATYTWTGPNGFTSALEDPVIANATVAMTGTYNLYLTALGCTSATASVPVTVNQTPATPVVASNSPVCSGNSINLTANTIAGVAYNWSGPNGFTSAAEDPVIANATVGMAGTYNLYLTALGCTSVTASVPVVVNQTPATPVVASNSPVCSGNPINLTSNTIAATYNWTGPNGFTSAAEDPVIANATVTMTGTYNLYLTALGCTSATASVPVTVNQTPATPVVASNSPVCSGNSINLTSNTIAATYNWTGPNGFTSAAEDPVIANATVGMTGTYNLYLTALGCTSATASVPVTVNQTPALPVIGSNSPVCQNGTLNLTANTVAGATYSWSGPNGFTSALEDPSIANVTLAATGNYSLYVTVTGCSSATANLNASITPLPATPVIGSNSPVCENGTINLTSTTIAGAAYNWSGPNGFTSTAEDPVLTPAGLPMNGNYSVYVVANACTSATATTPVVVYGTPATPVIASNSPVCAGAALNFTANTIAGATYAWSGPNGFASALEDPSIGSATVAASGNYSLYVTVNGCSSATANLSATVNPIPAAPVTGSNGPVCQSDVLNLTSNTIAGATYVWNGPNGFTSALEDPSITPAALNNAGNYTTYVVVLGCTSATATVPVVVNATPAVPVIGSNSPVCEGGLIQLTANSIAGATYHWSGPASYSSAAEDPTLSPAGLSMGGTYNLYVSVNNCNSATASLAVVVNPLPAAPVIGSDSPVCEGETLNLTSGGGAGLTNYWTGPNGFTSSLEDPSITPVAQNNAGNYSLYTVALGCTSSTVSTPVTVKVKPTADFAVTSQICLGADAFALYSGTAPANSTYGWQMSAGASHTGSGQGPITIDWATSGTHSVTLTVTQDGCDSDPVSHNVEVVAPVTPDAGPDQTVCSGASINVGNPNATGATFTWTTPNGITNPATAYSPASWANNGNAPISITITLQSDNQGCTATDNAVITVVPNPTASFNNQAAQCFDGNSFNFTAGGTFMPTATFQWSFSNANPVSSSLQNPTNIQFNQTGNNDVTLIISQNGCVSPPFTLPVLVVPSPQANFAYLPAEGCSPLLVQFTNQSTPATGLTYLWNFGYAGANGNTASPSFTYTQPGMYSVSLTVTDANGCSSSLTRNNIIHVHDNPTAGFTVNPQQIYIDEPFANIYNSAQGGVVSWQYDVESVGQFSVPQFTVNFTDTGWYDITQIVTNEFGCSDIFIQPVHVLPVSQIYVPNAFTPGTRDDLNNIFKPYGYGLNEYKMYIYNRWGEMLFSTSDLEEGWDGQVRYSKTEAKQDLYVYKIEYVDHRGNPKELLGNVMVLR